MRSEDNYLEELGAFQRLGLRFSWDLETLIRDYYSKRRLKWPSTHSALLWALTELAEAAEQLLSNEGGWVRNNPDQHEDYDPARLEEELGDTIFMCLVVGYTVGMDPLRAMLMKVQKKLEEEISND